MTLIMKRISPSIMWLLLVVLIGTYMSPGFAWQMIDSHRATEIASMLSGDGHHHHESDLHQHDDDGEGDIDTAHTQIGHLLSHLPAVVFDHAALPVTQGDTALFSIGTPAIASTESDPPYKPPRSFLFV